MFSALLERLSSFFDKHWLLRYFFPSLLFWGAGLLVFAVVTGLSESAALWQRQPTEVQVILLAGALFWVTLFAYGIANFSMAIVRLFEGYWQHFPLSWFREIRLRHYERRYLYLDAEIRLESDPRRSQRLERELQLFFPRHSDREKAVMPTRLGNIIRGAEVYSWQRYGIDSVVVWPRLWIYLPQEFIGSLEGARTSMEIMLVFSVLSFLFALIVSPLVIATLSWMLFSACASGFVLAWVFYRNSLHGALGYAELIKTAFDLYRGKLLEGLGFEPAETLEEEFTIWMEVSELLYRATLPATARLKGAPALQPAPPPAPESSWGEVLLAKLAAFFTAAPNPEPPVPTPAQAAAAPAVGAPPAPVRIRKPLDTLPWVYFGIVLWACGLTATGIAGRADSQVRAWKLRHGVPMYHLLRWQDVQQEPVARSALPGDAIYNGSDLVNAYTSQPLARGTVLRKSDLRRLADPRHLEETVLVGIPATASMVLGGNLRAGDLVDVLITPLKDAPEPSPDCRLEGRLVFDVKPVPADIAMPFVVVLSVPKVCRSTLSAAWGRLLLVRRP